MGVLVFVYKILFSLLRSRRQTEYTQIGMFTNFLQGTPETSLLLLCVIYT
jgi:hypothetical protein